MQFDHLFILDRRDPADSTGEVAAARNAEVLKQAGFVEGEPNTHPGQGSACRRFFFDNAMIEFLFLDDLAVAQRPPARLLRLAERGLPNSCPLGIGFRPSQATVQSSDSPSEINRPVFANPQVYHPEYLPPTLGIDVASPIEVHEPLWFHLPFVAPRPANPPSSDSDTDHPALARPWLTGVELQMPIPLSDARRQLCESSGVGVTHGHEWGVSLTFDFARRSRRLTLDTSVPLQIHS